MGRSEIALPVPTSANYRMSDTFTRMQTFSTIICISLISKHRSENVTKKNKQTKKQTIKTDIQYLSKKNFLSCLFVCLLLFCSVLFCSVLFFSVCFFQFSGSVYIVSYLKSALTSVPHVKKLLIRKC